MNVTAEYRYAIEIGSIIEAYFLECSGLDVTRETHPYTEGGVNNYTHHLPKQVTVGKITLKRGITTSKELWNWFQEGLYDGKVKMLNPSITLYDSEHKVVQRWDLTRAYPTRWSGPSLKSDSSQVAVETLELVCHGIQLS